MRRSDAARRVMRLAMLDAGLINSLDSDRLSIVFEPEAAALHAWCALGTHLGGV
jgi:hypothetical protein